MAKKRVKVKTNSLKVGHKLMTPADGLPYQVIRLAPKYEYNKARNRYEKSATCMWLDTKVVFQAFFADTGFYTLVDVKEGVCQIKTVRDGQDE